MALCAWVVIFGGARYIAYTEHLCISWQSKLITSCVSHGISSVLEGLSSLVVLHDDLIHSRDFVSGCLFFQVVISFQCRRYSSGVSSNTWSTSFLWFVDEHRDGLECDRYLTSPPNQHQSSTATSLLNSDIAGHCHYHLTNSHNC